MRKLLFSILIIVTLVFTGCGIFVSKEVSQGEKVFPDKNSAETGEEFVSESDVLEPVSLDILVIDYGNTWDYWLGNGGIKERVENENPNISLNVTVLPWKEATKEMEIRLFNNDPFDMAITENMEDLSERGVLESTLKYTESDFLSRKIYDLNTDKGIPVGVDPYVLFIKEDTSLETGIGEAAVSSAGWKAIIHGIEDHTNGKIPFFIDVTPESKGMSIEALYGSTGEKNAEGIAGSLISDVENNPNLRHKTAYDGVAGVCNGEIAMAVAPKGILTVLENVDTSGLLTINLPGNTKMLCDYLVVFKKDGEGNENRLKACENVIREYFGEGYKNYIEKEGFESALQTE